MKYVFHKLTPQKEVEPNWFKLKWKPIRNGTWNIYTFKSTVWKIRFSIRDSSAHNGWGRSWDGFAINIQLGKYEIEFWIHYNLICHRDGAFDANPQIPLSF